MSELLVIALTIATLYGLHQLGKALCTRRREPTILDRLQYDAEVHEITVILRGGQTITGTPDTRTPNRQYTQQPLHPRWDAKPLGFLFLSP